MNARRLGDVIGRRFGFTIVGALLLGALFVVGMPTVASAAAPAREVAAANSGYYQVRPGDSLGEIARYYGVTVQDIINANHLTSSTIYVGQRLYIPSGGSPTQAGCTSFYRVQRGDTLTAIAKRYRMNTDALARANGISNASHIVVGQRICIPQIYGNVSSGGTASGHSGIHTVQPGDTLSEIAQQYRVSMHKLMQLNMLKNPDHIYVGQRLRLR